MTQTTPTTVINVTVRTRGGYLYASSADLFGLNVVAPDEAEMRSRLDKAVKWLYRQNHDMDVEVMFPSVPAEFPRANTAPLEQLVIAKAA